MNGYLPRSFDYFKKKFMRGGNLLQVESIVLKAFKAIKKKMRANPFFFF